MTEPIFPILQSKQENSETAGTPPGELDKFDEERVRAAVTVALDAAMPHLVDEITAKVLLALKEY